MQFLILANFKSHKTTAEVRDWMEVVAPVAEQVKSKVQVLVAPAFVHLPTLTGLLENWNTGILLSSQDVSPFPPGAYTGAVNAPQLKDLGVTHCLIGHSERRHYFHETSNEVANKAKELISAGLTPVICLAQDDVVPQFAALDDNLQDKCLFCFEPPADIGGTIAAPSDLIQATVKLIRSYTSSPVLYGGSVTDANITSLLPLAIDGVLVATACLNPVQFNSILTQADHAR